MRTAAILGFKQIHCKALCGDSRGVRGDEGELERIK